MTEEIRPKGTLEKIVEEHGKKILIAGVAFILLMGGWYWYTSQIKPKKVENANNAIFMVQRYFEKDSINTVYEGDGEHMGAYDVIEQYGGTKAARLAHYYIGRTLMKESKYEEAIDHLKKTKFKDELMAPQTQTLIGDCYSELEQYEEAAEHYWEAATMRDNNYSAPIAYMKAGLVYEKLGNWEKALKAYEAIKNDFRESEQAKDIQKYISRAETRLQG